VSERPGRMKLDSKARMFLASLRLGCIAFGGLAVLATIRREFVSRRHILTDGEFAEIAGLAQALPGAVGVNTMTMLATRAGGWLAGPLAAVGYVLPSFVAMLVLAVNYTSFRHFPAVDGLLVGIAAGVVALVVFTAIELGRGGAIRSLRDGALAAAALVLVGMRWLGVLEAVLLAGLLGVATSARRWRAEPPLALPPWLLMALLGGAAGSTLLSLTTVFLRIGAATFGGGFVMIPFIEHEVVLRHGWISPVEFADAIAFGQITPGPVVISATFIGFRVAGLAGAVLATVAIFLPSVVLGVAAGGALERFGRHPVVAGFLSGVRPVVVGLLGSAALSLARAGVHDLAGWGVVACGVLALLRWRVHPLLLLVVSGALVLALRHGLALLF